MLSIHRFRLVLAGIIGTALLIWGLWTSGVFFTGPVPLPSTRIDAPVDADNWAVAGRDVAHTSGLLVHSGFEGKELWRIDTGRAQSASPAVSDGRVFFGTGDHRLLALESMSGDVLWERQLTHLVSQVPAVTRSTVYVAVRDGQLVALDRRGGMTRWRFQTDSPLFASPVVYRGVVYMGSWNGTLYAVDADTGEALWTFRADGSVVAPPVFQGDIMALATDDGLVYVIDLTTGKKRLIFDTLNALSESPVFTDDHILVSTGRGRLAAVDWTKLEYPFERALRSWRQQLFIWGLQTDPPLPKGLAWGLVLSRDSALSAPAVIDGVAYTVSRNGRLHAISVADGSRLWEYDAGTLVHTAPAVAGRFVYFGAADGNIHVVERSTGELAQTIYAAAKPSGQIVVTEDGLYVTSEEAGTLAAFR